jgi:prepilin-type N-terminal cleavage/methylation domain-containing protein
MNAHRGYTLLECIVAMAVAGVTLVVGLELYVQTQRAMGRQEAAAARLGTEADLLSLLRRDVRAAALVAPESSAAQLVLVGLDGTRTTYRAAADRLTRTGTGTAAQPAQQALPLAVRFAYPGGRAGRLVEISWGKSAATRRLVLHLRNGRT